MTTIYVNHTLGIVMTDTRATTTITEYLFGIIPIKKYEVYNDNGLKAIHVHDRIFVESGHCHESTKILRYLTDGTPIKPEHKKLGMRSICFLVDKNWVILFIIDKGKLTKKFIPLSGTSWYSTGSGNAALFEALKVYNFNPTLEEAIAAFKTVHFSDPYTNSYVQIYNM